MEEETIMVGSLSIGPEPPGAVLNGRGFKIIHKGDLRDILLPLGGGTSNVPADHACRAGRVEECPA